MARTPHDVTDAELSVLQVLWDEGATTIRRLTDVLYPRGGTSHYSTVQKLLDRLEAKGYVQRKRVASPHLFEATLDRDALIGRQLRSMAEKLCGGSLAPLLTNLVRAQVLSASERAELRALIAQLDRKPRRGERS